MFDADKLEKFDISKHSKELNELISLRPYIVTFITNPVWLSKGKYYIHRDKGFYTLCKKSQMYGKQIVYALHPPFSKDANLDTEKAYYTELSKEVDFQLSSLDVEFLGLPTPKEALHSEFIYKASNYPDGLPGKDFIRWRKVYNTIQSDQYTIELHANKVPFQLPSKMLQVISSWKDDRKKYVANFTEWYVSNLRALDNFLVVAIMNKSKQIVSFSISQRIGNQIYFLDEKAHRNLPPLRNQARVQHTEALKYWAKESNNPDILMTSGIGDKKYTHEEHTYDLNEHKRSLKPHLEVTIYKVRKNA